MSVYVTISCNECKSDLGYGNAVASVTIRDGIEYHIHHTFNCGCKDNMQACTKVYNPKEYDITVCKYCNSKDLYSSYECDE